MFSNRWARAFRKVKKYLRKEASYLPSLNKTVISQMAFLPFIRCRLTKKGSKVIQAILFDVCLLLAADATEESIKSKAVKFLAPITSQECISSIT